jgi:putative PIN family toxin of toxin-antitoxin system
VVRLVIDPNVFVSGLIAQGPPAEVVDLMRYGELRAVVCPQLLDELEGVLARPRFRRYVELDEVKDYIEAIKRDKTLGWEP